MEVISDVTTRLLAEMSAHQDSYDIQDVESVATDKWTVRRYVLATKSDKDKAFAMARDAMKWRKAYGVNTTTDLDFPQEFYKLGAVFSYGSDRSGQLVIYFRVKLYRNFPNLDQYIKKFVVHIINKCDKQMAEKGCAMVWDLTDAGPSNCDLSLLKFLITVLKNYFPHPKGYIVAFGVNPVISAIIKLAVKLLPEEDRHRLIIAKKEDLFGLIAEQNIPDFLGGNCPVDYRLVPDGAPNAFDFAVERGIASQDIQRVMKFYDKYIQ